MRPTLFQLSQGSLSDDISSDEGGRTSRHAVFISRTRTAPYESRNADVRADKESGDWALVFVAEFARTSNWQDWIPTGTRPRSIDNIDPFSFAQSTS